MLRVLILGGTAEARALAGALDGRVHLMTSLAGAVAAPLLPRGEVKVGGLGGVAGLRGLVASWRPDVVVDATHPFAATITEHAVEAVEVPLIVLQRPAWTESPGDDWTSFASLSDCASALRALPDGCVFLTTGRRDLATFASDDRHAYLLRSIDRPQGEQPPRCTVVLDRGPYTVEGELSLMTSYSVDVLVSKNSGGDLTSAKLTAARQLGLPVLMVERPPLPPGVTPLRSVETVLEHLAL